MTAEESMIRRLMDEAFLAGYLKGLEAFAWWKDGVQYVGTTSTTLHEAVVLAKQNKLWNQKGGA